MRLFMTIIPIQLPCAFIGLRFWEQPKALFWIVEWSSGARSESMCIGAALPIGRPWEDATLRGAEAGREEEERAGRLRR